MSTSGVVLSPLCEDPCLLSAYMNGRSSHYSKESILIFLRLCDSVIPMRVLESDSIASVKFRIQAYKGVVVRKQKLVLGGRELARNDSLLMEYGLSEGNVLQLVIRLSDLQAITVETICGKLFEFHIERSRNIAYLKQQIVSSSKTFIDFKEQELFCKGEKLGDQKLIDDICGDRDAVLHLFVRKSAKVRTRHVEKDFELSIVAPELNVEEEKEKRAPVKSQRVLPLERELIEKGVLLHPIIVNPKLKLPSVAENLIHSALGGLMKGFAPIRSSEGSGGTYLMRNVIGEKYVAVFKPMDEEPKAINNPQGLPLSLDGEGLKRGTKVGEGAFREVGAYLLDHPMIGRGKLNNEIGFSGVPPTFMVRCLHSAFNHPNGYTHSAQNFKIGSLQMFVENSGSCEDMGPRAFPVEEVHKISVLDIRLANADRHAGNILVCRDKEKGSIKLVPIDHGYCLPEKFEDCTFDWLHWPQARVPYNAETVNYIRSLDAEEDIELLQSHGWTMSLECVRTLRISTMLLKKGVERGLTPFAIGSIMCRETLKKESIIEEIVREAHNVVLSEMSESYFLESVSEIMDHRLNQIIFK